MVSNCIVEDKQLKICFLTALSEYTDYEQCKKEVDHKPHERHFVAKPVSNTELIRRINEILTNDNYNLDI
jgi:CheY-like chemotaxis protein